MTLTEISDDRHDLGNVEKRALDDLINSLVDQGFLHSTTNTDEYLIAGTLGDTSTVTTSRIGVEDDFVSEFYKLQTLIAVYSNLFVRSSRTEQQPVSYDTYNFNKIEEISDNVVNDSTFGSLFTSVMLDLYKNRWGKISTALKGKMQKEYKREELEDHIKNIIEAITSVLYNFIILIKLIVQNNKYKSIRTKELEISDIKQFSKSKEIDVARIPNLLLEFTIEGGKNRQLLIIENVPEQVSNGIISFCEEHIGTVKVIIINTEKITTDLIKDPNRMLGSALSPQFQVVPWDKPWKKIDVLISATFSDAIESILKWCSQTELFSKAHRDASTFIDQSNYEDAVRSYDKAIALDSNAPDTFSAKALTLSLMKRHEEALEYFDKALDIDPNFIDAVYNKGIILGGMKRYEEALEYFDKALDMDPSNVYALGYKGIALSMLGKYEDALVYQQKALDNAKSIGDKALELQCYVNLGDIYEKLARYEEALDYFDKALDINPNYIDALNNKGSALDNLGKYQEAIDLFDKALSIDQKNVDALNNKGSALYNLERYDEAIDCFDRAIGIDSHEPRIWCNKGWALEKLGKYDEAINHFDKALSIDPTYVQAIDGRREAVEKLTMTKRK